MKESTIGERIKHIRKSYRYTQDEFAKRIFKTDAYISLAENNKIAVSDDVMRQIARVYSVDFEWLKHGSEQGFEQGTVISGEPAGRSGGSDESYYSDEKDHSNEEKLSRISDETDIQIEQQYKDIRDRYVLLRKKRGQTQKQFAESLGCSLVQIKKIEQNKAKPSIPFMHKTAEICNVSYSWLYRGEGAMVPYEEEIKEKLNCVMEYLKNDVQELDRIYERVICKG